MEVPAAAVADATRGGHNRVVMSKVRTSSTATVGSAEFKARYLELINHVREARVEYTVTRHGKPVARLVPVERDAPTSPLGTMRGTVLLYDRPFDPVPARWSVEQDPQE